jgi:hypothetical protein
MLDLLDALTKPAVVESDRRPWPSDGQRFTVLMDVRRYPDNDFEAELVGELSPDLSEVLYDVGTFVTCDMFELEEVPKKSGLYWVTLKYGCERYLDWESGHPEFSDWLTIESHRRRSMFACWWHRLKRRMT